MVFNEPQNPQSHNKQRLYSKKGVTGSLCPLFHLPWLWLRCSTQLWHFEGGTRSCLAHPRFSLGLYSVIKLTYYVILGYFFPLFFGWYLPPTSSFQRLRIQWFTSSPISSAIISRPPSEDILNWVFLYLSSTILATSFALGCIVCLSMIF